MLDSIRLVISLSLLDLQAFWLGSLDAYCPHLQGLGTGGEVAHGMLAVFLSDVMDIVSCYLFYSVTASLICSI